MKVLLGELEGDQGRLGETLVRIGAITQNELEQALAVQQQAPEAKLGEILAKEKLAPEPIVQAAVQKQGQAREKKSEESRFIRVSADKLDDLISLIGELVIGVNSNHLPELGKVRNVKNLLERAVMMNLNFNVYTRKGACDYFIEAPGLGKYSVFDLKKAPELFQAGYQEAMRVIEANPSLIELNS
jgi:chemotaxis protein histidine kinase CheA